MILGINDVTIESPFGLVMIKKAFVHAKANHHARFYAELLLDESSIAVMDNQLDGSNVRLVIKDTKEVLFAGLIEDLSITKRKDVLYASMSCVGHSIITDLELHDRIVQCDTSDKELLQSILGADAGMVCADESSLPLPTIQYRETNWEFAKRLAAESGRMVIPNYTLENPYVALGYPDREAKTIEIVNISNMIQPTSNDKLKFNEQKLQKRITTHDIVFLGDKLNVDGEPYRVSDLEFELLDDGFLFTCLLSEESAYQAYRSTHLQGLELVGTVVDRNTSELKVAFDIEAGASQEIWYPYDPDTLEAFHTIPELGTRVVVRFMDGQGSVKFCLHSSSGEYPEASIKMLHTEEERVLKMESEKMSIFDPDNRITLQNMSYTLDAGATIHMASGDISVKAGRHVQVISPEEIIVRKAGLPYGVQLAKNEINIYSDNTFVRADGSVNKAYLPRDTTPETAISSSLAAAVVGANVTVMKVNLKCCNAISFCSMIPDTTPRSTSSRICLMPFAL